MCLTRFARLMQRTGEHQRAALLLQRIRLCLALLSQRPHMTLLATTRPSAKVCFLRTTSSCGGMENYSMYLCAACLPALTSAVSVLVHAGQRLVAAADAAVADAAAAAAPSLARCHDLDGGGAGTDTEDDPMQSTPPKRSRKRCAAFPHLFTGGLAGCALLGGKKPVRLLCAWL